MRQVPAIYMAYGEIWDGNHEEALRVVDQYQKSQGFHPHQEDARFYAMLASGQYREDPQIFNPKPEGSSIDIPRAVYVHALNNDIDMARETLENWQIEHKVDDLAMIVAEASLGNRQAANQYATLIDARTGGTLVLTDAIKGCLCGAPFDLEATPVFRKRIEATGFTWPPISPIKYPAKDW